MFSGCIKRVHWSLQVEFLQTFTPHSHEIVLHYEKSKNVLGWDGLITDFFFNFLVLLIKFHL